MSGLVFKAQRLEAGSYLRLMDCVYHSTLGLRVIQKKDLDVGAKGNNPLVRRDAPLSTKSSQIVGSETPSLHCKSSSGTNQGKAF